MPTRLACSGETDSELRPKPEALAASKLEAVDAFGLPAVRSFDVCFHLHFIATARVASKAWPVKPEPYVVDSQWYAGHGPGNRVRHGTDLSSSGIDLQGDTGDDRSKVEERIVLGTSRNHGRNCD